jgi:hypothetical protein
VSKYFFAMMINRKVSGFLIKSSPASALQRIVIPRESAPTILPAVLRFFVHLLRRQKAEVDGGKTTCEALKPDAIDSNCSNPASTFLFHIIYFRLMI